MEVIKISVHDGNVVTPEDLRLTTGNVNRYTVELSLDSDWKGLIVYMLFNGFKCAVEDNMCIVPEFSSTGPLEIGVVGYSAENGKLVKKISPKPGMAMIIRGSYREDEAEPPEATLDTYEQILQIAEHAEEIASSIRADADNGAFNGTDGADGLSAYEIAVKNGYEGTEEEWLESLKAEPDYEKLSDLEAVIEELKKNASGDTLKTVFAFTEDEFTEILMNLMMDFTSNVPINIIYVTDEGTSQLIILDSGSGDVEDCIMIENGFSDLPFTSDIDSAINLNSKKNVFTEYSAYKNKTFSTGNVNTISFSGTGTSGIRSVRALVTLPPLKTVKFGIGANYSSTSLTADKLLAETLDYTINHLILEIDTYSEGYCMISITLTDPTGTLYSNKWFDTTTASGIGNFRFRIDSASSATYTLDYVGIGG